MKITILSALAAAILIFPPPAFAYIDPGTGSMILQLLLAGVAGLGVLCKLFWHRITGFFRRSKAPTKLTSDLSQSNEDEEKVLAGNSQ